LIPTAKLFNLPHETPILLLINITGILIENSIDLFQISVWLGLQSLWFEEFISTETVCAMSTLSLFWAEVLQRIRCEVH